MRDPGDTHRDHDGFNTPVSSPEELAAQLEAVAAVRLARIKRAEATAELKRRIVAAVDAGAAVKDIAKAADFSRQRIWQLYNERDR